MSRLSHMVRVSLGVFVLSIPVVGCDLASEPLAPDDRQPAPAVEMDPLLAELLGEVRTLARSGENTAEREVYSDAIRLMLDAPDPDAAPAPRWARGLIATDPVQQVRP